MDGHVMLGTERWPERHGLGRVLIEHPDSVVGWAHADVLGAAGYDVALCRGQSADEACPLLANNLCALVDGADVVVSSVDLAASHALLPLLRLRRGAVLVAEGTRHELDAVGADLDGIIELEEPVTGARLVAAVAAVCMSLEADDV